jgi:hypothetical protein
MRTMEKILEYSVVTGDHPQTLDDEVNKKLASGWTLRGGVSVATVRTATHELGSAGDEEPRLMWAQAMVKET